MSHAIAAFVLHWRCALAAAGVGGLVALLMCSLLAMHLRRTKASRGAQQADRESDERLRLALAATSEIVWDYDVAAGTVDVPRWAQAYGYPPEETPKTFADLGRFVHPDDMGPLAERLEEAIAGKRDTIEAEHRVRAGTGEWLWMLARAQVVAREAGGRAVRIVGTCANITDRKKMLSRLQIAERMASVGTLAAGVAHEINNPLAYLTGNIGFVVETLGDVRERLESGRADGTLKHALEESQRALDEAQEGAQRVRRIVRDLKHFSRADDEQKAAVDLRRVVERAVNLADSEIRQRARLTMHLKAVPAVIGGESRLCQVFLNLLVNAAQAIPEGQAERNRIEVETSSDPGHAVVEVRDTGCGIATEHRQRIFDPFFTTKPVGIGTGLGLAICHGIVTALGGEIEVESEVGVGSTFRVKLPVAEGAASPKKESRTSEPAARRGRILVVDDEALFCKTAERILASHHDVVALSDPAEALARIRKGERFDLILSDLVMPGMTGMDLHDAIERTAPDLAERMLFVTGGAFTESAVRFAATMADRVLDKPLGPEVLRAAVSSALDRFAAAKRAERL